MVAANAKTLFEERRPAPDWNNTSPLTCEAFVSWAESETPTALRDEALPRPSLSPFADFHGGQREHSRAFSQGVRPRRRLASQPLPHR